MPAQLHGTAAFRTVRLNVELKKLLELTTRLCRRLFKSRWTKSIDALSPIACLSRLVSFIGGAKYRYASEVGIYLYVPVFKEHPG